MPMNGPWAGMADAPDMSGYADDPLSDYPEGFGYYAQPEMAGYVRQTRAPLITRAARSLLTSPATARHEQFSDGDPFSGYQRPKSVNASCGQFTPQPGVSDFVPETFKPLW